MIMAHRDTVNQGPGLCQSRAADVTRVSATVMIQRSDGESSQGPGRFPTDGKSRAILVSVNLSRAAAFEWLSFYVVREEHDRGYNLEGLYHCRETFYPDLMIGYKKII